MEIINKMTFITGELLLKEGLIKRNKNKLVNLKDLKKYGLIRKTNK